LKYPCNPGSGSRAVRAAIRAPSAPEKPKASKKHRFEATKL
jgi:hypothetical protein